MQKYKSRNENFTLANYGTFYSFNPNKKVINPYTEKEDILLNVNIEFVKIATVGKTLNETTARRKLIYIIDNNRQELSIR